MVAVVRPDLSQRTAISKSALTGFDYCQEKSWLDRHARLPLRVSEKISFGSALDAATEALVIGMREGWSEAASKAAAAEAIDFIAERDAMELPADELKRAVDGFWAEVLPGFDLTNAETQPDVSATIAGLGDCNGHPDLIVGGEPWDVKSSSRAKEIPSLELGFYAVLLEEARGQAVNRAGYLTWIRSGRGRWTQQPFEITGEVRRWVWETASRYARAVQLDDRLNEGAATPTNYTFLGGPKRPSFCQATDCQYAPWNSGPCEIAWQGGEE